MISEQAKEQIRSVVAYNQKELNNILNYIETNHKNPEFTLDQVYDQVKDLKHFNTQKGIDLF